MVIEKKTPDYEKKNKRVININFLITIFILPITLIEILILNHVDKNLVALIAQIELASTFIFSVILFGGSNSIIIFMQNSEFKDKLKIILVNLIPAISLLILFIYAPVFEKLKNSMFNLISESNLTLFSYLFLWIIFYISISIFKAEKSLLVPVIFEKIFSVLRLVTFITITLFISYFFEENNLVYNMKKSVFVAVCLLIILLWIIYFKKSNEMKVDRKNSTLKIKNVIEFNMYAFVLGILAFTYEKIDQIVINNNFSLAVLAIYFTLLKISFLMDFIPKIFNSIALPTFVKLNKNGIDNLKEIKNYYRQMLNKNFAFSIMTGLTLMSIMEITLRMGYMKEFSEYLNIFFLLLTIKVISVPSSISNALINSFEKNKGLLVLSIITTGVQIIIVLCTIDILGLYSVVIAKLVAAIIGQIIYRVILKQLKVETSIDGNYVKGLTLFFIAGFMLVIGVGYLIPLCMLIIFVIFKEYYLDFITGFLKIKS